MRRPWPTLVLILCAIGYACTAAAQEPGVADWRDEWEVAEGFSIEVDSRGYQFPAAMAFVPEPGPRPEDPAYFVVELRGRLRVVSRDRNVHLFAEGITDLVPTRELPSYEGETGAAGVCVDGETGYVFATFTYEDEGGELRNGLTRFSTRPGVFALEPSGQLDLRHILAADPAVNAHQIGPCEVHGGHLYVSVGDAHRAEFARDLDRTNGKILRMTLDGRPVPTNPFFSDDGVDETADYVFAYGLRNPFGLRVVEGRVFVHDNGPNIDRFIEVRAGDDALWSGTNWSFAGRADLLFPHAVSPVGFDISVEGTPFPEAWREHVFVTTSGSTMDPPGPSSMYRRAVLSFAYDRERRQARSVPTPFLRYRGFGVQLPVEAVFGPDGLYVVNLMPDVLGSSPILRIEYAPDRAHPHVVSAQSLLELKPANLLKANGCNGCHDSDQPGRSIAPSLRARKQLSTRIAMRLGSEEYRAAVRELDARSGEFWQSTRPWRAEVLAARENAQIKKWIFYHLLEPKFDNPSSAMPNLGLGRSEAQALAEYLGRRNPDHPAVPSPVRRPSEIIGEARWVYVAGALVAGVLVGAAVLRLFGRSTRG